eukprot:253968-Chlamydomonas_euryale.AAC.1
MGGWWGGGAARGRHHKISGLWGRTRADADTERQMQQLITTVRADHDSSMVDLIPSSSEPVAAAIPHTRVHTGVSHTSPHRCVKRESTQ